MGGSISSKSQLRSRGAGHAVARAQLTAEPRRRVVAGRIARPVWTVESPNGQLLIVEHDPILRRWRVTPGGYERRLLRHAVAVASGSRPTAAWILELEERLLLAELAGAPAGA